MFPFILSLFETMKTSTIEHKVHFSATPQQVYEALMNSALHSEFTQSESIIGSKPGESYSSYNGYIEGVILELKKDAFIRKSWMAYEDGWPEGHFSEIKFWLESSETGTDLNFTHDGVPAEKIESIGKGWIEYYWEPMEKMFLSNKSSSLT